jgi:hypothetical protein
VIAQPVLKVAKVVDLRPASSVAKVRGSSPVMRENFLIHFQSAISHVHAHLTPKEAREDTLAVKNAIATNADSVCCLPHDYWQV